MYKFVLLDSRPIPAAVEANEAVFNGPPVLGIEVTVPALAARCVLGNIDPQHTDGDVDTAAIEAALTVDLPPVGSVLATVRADLDSVGAMAVLRLRAHGIMVGDGVVCEQIQMIAQLDKFARGPWPGRRPLDMIADESATTEVELHLAAIGAEVSDFRLPLADRVASIVNWLLYGEEPAGRRVAWEAEQQKISTALASGEIRVVEAAGGRIAVVESTHRDAIKIGYRVAPVVVALNPAFRLGGGEAHRKLTVCQYALGHVDLKSSVTDLTRLEAGWGGSPTIIGSSQGLGSLMTIEQVVDVLEKHLC